MLLDELTHELHTWLHVYGDIESFALMDTSRCCVERVKGVLQIASAAASAPARDIGASSSAPSARWWEGRHLISCAKTPQRH